MGIEPARAEYPSINRARHYKKKKIAQYGVRTCACKKYLERELNRRSQQAT